MLRLPADQSPVITKINGSVFFGGLSGSQFPVWFLSTAVLIVSGGVLSLYCVPGGGSSLQRHAQLADRHCHCPVGGSCLLPGCPSTRVQTAAHHHQATAFSDSLHPVHLLLCPDRDGQKWLATSAPQHFSQLSAGEPNETLLQDLLYCSACWSSQAPLTRLQPGAATDIQRLLRIDVLWYCSSFITLFNDLYYEPFALLAPQVIVYTVYAFKQWFYGCCKWPQGRDNDATTFLTERYMCECA